MKQVKCNSCGANDLVEKNGFLVCSYCHSRFVIEKEEKYVKSTDSCFGDRQMGGGSSIALNDDVQRLLEKCKNEPKNAKRYANLVLDIDPDNEEALKYLG